MPRRIVVDTEWTAVPWSPAADLLWIGLADEDGQDWCALSSDAAIDPVHDPYVAALLRIITPDVPRLCKAEMSTAIQAFCGQVDEFWAWIPTPQSFAPWSKLGDCALAAARRWRLISRCPIRAAAPAGRRCAGCWPAPPRPAHRHRRPLAPAGGRG